MQVVCDEALKATVCLLVLGYQGALQLQSLWRIPTAAVS